MTLRRLSFVAALAAAAAALSACTDFDDLPRGLCGNGLVEPGEDCDAEDPRCVRCSITCTAAADCPSADYACGVDGLCHAPGGALAQPSAPVTFQVDDLRVTDVDHDGTGDVLGVSKTSAVVRYGDAAGALAAGESFVTPAQSGPPSFGDLDGDGALDLVLETLDGIVSFTSRHGSLAPAAIEAPIYGMDGKPLDFETMFVIGPQQLGAFIVDDGGAVFLAAIDLLQPSQPFVTAPCTARLGSLPRARFDRASVDIYQASAPGAAVHQLVVAFVTTAGEPCVTAIHGSPGGAYVLDDITPAGAAPLRQHPKLVDLDSDGDPCPALVNSDSGAQLRRWDGALAGGRCTLAAAGAAGAALPPTPGAPASAVVIGRAPLVPPLLGVASDALVMSTGVYVVTASAIGEVYTSPRPLGKVAHADLDADGDVDLIVAPAGEDDLDVLYRFPLGVELLRLDTASRVTSITAGDYDGNGIPDLAYTEAAIGHQRMMIAYGTRDRPLPAVQVATFSDVASVTPIELVDSVDRLGIADDLFVVQPGAGGGEATISLLHGSPQRTMLSFFDPRPDGSGAQMVLRAAVIGWFMGGPEPDLLALATQPIGGAPGVRAWAIPGTARGWGSAPSAGVPATGLADCERGAGTGVCIADALYLPWPVAPDHDVILAIDRPAAAIPPAARVLDPGALATTLVATPAPELVTGLPPGMWPRALHAADVDGDGAPELVAAFGARPGAAPAGSVRVCEVDAAGDPQRCDELTPVIQAIAPAVTACIDAAPGRLSPRDRTTTPSAAVDLVVLCRDAGTASGLYRISYEAGAPRAALLAGGVDLRAIRVGDVSGDGVDDVVALAGGSGSQTLVAYRQCTSREAGGCRNAAAAAAAPAAAAAAGGAP
jgi:hypothetical protein